MSDETVGGVTVLGTPGGIGIFRRLGHSIFDELSGVNNDPRWLREQLELLADEVRFGSLSATPEQMGRLLANIAKGYDWREGAWK